MTQNMVNPPVLLDVLPAYEQRLQQSPAVSVIVPVYNKRYFIAAAIEQLLKLQSDLYSDLEIIIADDGSTDGTWEIVQRLASTEKRMKLCRHPHPQGQGAAIQTALQYVTGDVCIIHKLSTEVFAPDIPTLLQPFITEGADAVYGSRYVMASYRPVLLYRHSLINKLLSLAVSWFTDLNLSDVEARSKAINTSLLRSIPLRSTSELALDVELTMKLAKRRSRIFEVPIRYAPAAHDHEKVGNSFAALATILKFLLIDDMYHQDKYGSNILSDLQHARRLNAWMGDTLRPYIGDRVLEIGAGIGTLTKQFIPRELYVASDIDPHYLDYLRSYSIGKPYLRVLKVDANEPDDFALLQGHFDTVLMVNVLEHVPDEQTTLKNIYHALAPGGRAVILVPQHPSIYGSLDHVLEHRERYTARKLAQSLQAAGFRVEKLFDFNRTSAPSWVLNGRILKRTGFSRVQLKVLETIMPAVRRFDRIWPWGGLSVIGVGVKG